MTGFSLDQDNIFTPVEFAHREQDLTAKSLAFTFVSGIFLMKHKPQHKNLFYFV